MRNTKYARELARAIYSWPDSEARLERLFIKARERDEIRFSWWRNNRLLPRPLDVTEDELFDLLKEAMKQNVFSNSFLLRLKELIETV